MGARGYAMSDFSPTLVLQTSIAKSPNDMANVQIKSEKLTPFGGIFPIMEQFDVLLGSNHRLHLGIEMHMVWFLRKWDFKLVNCSPAKM